MMGSNKNNNMGLMFRLVSLVLVLQGWLLPSIQGDVHYYDFILMEKNFTKLCSTKSILTVNGSFPGPEIRIHAGDTVFVNVYNKGNYGVTIHWHGVRQPRNPWSDGPEYVTQCPIAAGTNFTQEIIFSKEVGTLWYHAHSDWTRATVHGPIVILPPTGTSYPFPITPYAEQTLVLGEWYKGDVMANVEYATTYGADTNVSDAYTINGEPGDFYDCSSDTTYRLSVDYGKTYHLRVINSVMNEETWFGIANHTLTVVGMDAAYLKPITVDYIFIIPGQTMDVLVTANQTPSHYYIMGAPFSDTPGAADTTNTTAILQYNGNYTEPATPPSPTFPGRTNTTAAADFTSLLRSLASEEYPVDVPVNITKNVLMTVSVNQLPNTTCPNNTCLSGNGNRPAASLNNISFVNPSIDFLQAYYYNLTGVFERDFPHVPPLAFNYTGDEANNYLIPLQATKALMIDYNAEVELVWQGTNLGAENHPMHLHGYSFYVVGQGFGNFDNVTSPLTYNLIDPPEVNTFAVPKNGWVAMRFKADNPGVWFMHCHLERHASWGMDTVLIVKNGPTELASIKPPPSMPSCS